jgi:hypothetical protein
VDHGSAIGQRGVVQRASGIPLQAVLIFLLG